MKVEIQDICFGYAPGKLILEHLDYISAEQNISILAGVNGCGKSTLLKIMAGILTPHSGEVLLDGVPLKKIPARRRAQFLAYLPQNPVIPESFTVRELLDCSRYARGTSKKSDRAAVIRALEDTGIAHLADRQLSRLSGGEKQRAFLAFALAGESELLLLDEPFSALDPAAFRELFSLLVTLKTRRRFSVIMVLHDINRALRYGDRIIGLKNGRICFDLPSFEAGAAVPALYDLPDEAVFSTAAGEKFFL